MILILFFLFLVVLSLLFFSFYLRSEEERKIIDEITKLSTSTKDGSLIFKSNNEAFRVACKYHEYPFNLNNAQLGIVKSNNDMSPILTKDHNDRQVAMINIASDTDEIYIKSKTISSGGPEIKEGDLVLLKYTESLEELDNLGVNLIKNEFYIVAILSPEYNYESNQWKIKFRWEKENDAKTQNFNDQSLTHKDTAEQLEYQDIELKRIVTIDTLLSSLYVFLRISMFLLSVIWLIIIGDWLTTLLAILSLLPIPGQIIHSLILLPGSRLTHPHLAPKNETKEKKYISFISSSLYIKLIIIAWCGLIFYYYSLPHLTSSKIPMLILMYIVATSPITNAAYSGRYSMFCQGIYSWNQVPTEYMAINISIVIFHISYIVTLFKIYFLSYSLTSALMLIAFSLALAFILEMCIFIKSSTQAEK